SLSWSGWGIRSRPPSRQRHHPEPWPHSSRDLGVCSSEADPRRWGFMGFFARSSWPAPLSHPPPGGGSHLAGGYPANLRAHP
ncbi:MAG: hypothetical protein ACK56I_37245, partial [bacterium]